MEAGFGTTVGLLQPFSIGRGFPQLKVLGTPAAGAGVTYSIAGSGWESVRAVAFTLATSAAVANRVPRLRYLDGDGVPFAGSSVSTAQAASTTVAYNFMVGIGQVVGVAGAQAAYFLPDIFLGPGWSLELSIVTVDVADQLSNLRVYTETFPTGPTGPPEGAYQSQQP